MSKPDATSPWGFTDADYSMDQLARASALIEGVAGNPETVKLPADITKDMCHLRHHAPDGTAYLSGVNTARQRLKQTKIPASELAAADAHLLGHLKNDFGKKDAMPELKRM